MSQSLILCGIDSFWKKHPDADNVWVSPEGRVLKRINQHHPERPQWYEYALGTDKDGYKYLKIAGKKWLIHRLVYTLFVGPLDAKKVVCHLDNCAANNHWSNLLQDTQKANMAHKKLHGTHQSGEKHPRALHTDNQAAAVKSEVSLANRYANGRLVRGETKRIADHLGVSLHFVRDIASKGKSAWAL